MIRITITAGTEKDKFGHRLSVIQRAQALATIRGTLAADFGGYSEFRGTGGWVDGNTGRQVTEECARFVILTEDNGTDPRTVATMIRDALRQQSVLMEVEYVAAEFVELSGLEAAAA